MFNKQNGQGYCTTCLSQCCMFTKRLTEVNLVSRIAERSVYHMCMWWLCVLHQFFNIKVLYKLVDCEKALNVSDREEHAENSGPHL